MSDLPAFQEPRKFFLAQLIKKVFEIYEVIYFGGKKSHALTMMQGIIDLLTEEHKKQLKEVSEKIEKLRTTGDASKEQIEEIFSKLNDYLGVTYFKEFNFATPLNTRPKHITVEQ